MYTDHDPLQDFYDSARAAVGPDVKLPPPPEKGSLDINEVMQSDFFFA